MCMAANYAKSPLPALRWMHKVNPILKSGQDKYDREESESKKRETEARNRMLKIHNKYR